MRYFNLISFFILFGITIRAEPREFESRILDVYEDYAWGVNLNGDLHCEPAHGVCANGVCSDFLLTPTEVTLILNFEQFARLKHDSILTAKGIIEDNRDPSGEALCAKVETIRTELERQEERGYSTLDVFFYGYLEDKVIPVGEGFCERHLIETIQVNLDLPHYAVLAVQSKASIKLETFMCPAI